MLEYLINCILDLKQNYFFILAELLRNEPTDFILLYEKFLVSLQERCTTYHAIRRYRKIYFENPILTFKVLSMKILIRYIVNLMLYDQSCF